MPDVLVQLEDNAARIAFLPGASLHEILDASEYRVRCGCRGTGVCGLCRVRIRRGATESPTPNERLLLSQEELESGVRLACQVWPHEDIEIALVCPAPPSRWRTLNAAQFGHHTRPDSAFRQAPNATSYGVAVDLGTTHISLSLHEIGSGRKLTGRWGKNPQASFGSDVMTRLLACVESDKTARIMADATVESIGEGLQDMALRDGIDLHRVVRLTVVGNTAMLAILAGHGHRELLEPDAGTYAVDCRPPSTTDWVQAWDISPQAVVETVGPLAGFVGSDLLAGVVATQLIKRTHPSLLIDFGTNSEMAVWDGRDLWVTSAAGGPAFEGSGIRCGMPAEPGAIYRVRQEDNLRFEVIGNGAPRGLCGSGLVDLIACLTRDGTISPQGRFTSPLSGGALVVDSNPQRELVLTKRDVDLLQRAKAGIAVGFRELLDRAGLNWCDLRRVCVAGTFGRFLDVGNAQQIGLLPPVEPALVELCGNTAIAGCEELLLAAGAATQFREARALAKMVNLDETKDFFNMFLEHLYLQPADDLPQLCEG